MKPFGYANVFKEISRLKTKKPRFQGPNKQWWLRHGVCQASAPLSEGVL